jgi:hypothetical protein
MSVPPLFPVVNGAESELLGDAVVAASREADRRLEPRATEQVPAFVWRAYVLKIQQPTRSLLAGAGLRGLR